jgi:hypothetical protein
MDLSPPLNHVFVDYENVQALDLSVFRGKGVTFTLLVGPHKKKLDVELVEMLFTHAASVEFVRLDSSGKNALDFILAYYVGRAVAADPEGFFHIISKDKGYDPMIKHLQSRHLRVRRHDDFSTLTFSGAGLKAPVALKAATALAVPKTTTTAADDLMIEVVAHLRKQVKNRPKKRKSLVSHLTTFHGKRRSATEVEALIAGLTNLGHITIDGKDAVTYSLQEST